MSHEIRRSEDPVDQDLEYVRKKRIEIIDSLTKKGVPAETETLSVLLSALNDMDRTSIGKKRIKVESDAIAINKQASELIATIYMNPNSKSLDVGSIVDAKPSIPVIGDKLPNVELLEGEMAVGDAQLDYETFMKRMGD